MERTLRDPGHRGFTLIEVVGALLIFAIGILIAASISNGVTTQMRDATLRSEITAIGRQTLDSLSLLSYADLPAGTSASNNVTLEGRTYTRTWTVTQEGVRARRVLVEVESSVSGGPVFSRATYLGEEW